MYLTVFTSIPVTWFSLLINSMYPFQSQNQIQTIKDKQFIKICLDSACYCLVKANCLIKTAWMNRKISKIDELRKIIWISFIHTFLSRCVFISYGDFMIRTILLNLGTRKKLLDYTWVINLHTFIYITFSFEPWRFLERADLSRVLSSFKQFQSALYCMWWTT